MNYLRNSRSLISCNSHKEALFSKYFNVLKICFNWIILRYILKKRYVKMSHKQASLLKFLSLKSIFNKRMNFEWILNESSNYFDHDHKPAELISFNYLYLSCSFGRGSSYTQLCCSLAHLISFYVQENPYIFTIHIYLFSIKTFSRFVKWTKFLLLSFRFSYFQPNDKVLICLSLLCHFSIKSAILYWFNG